MQVSRAERGWRRDSQQHRISREEKQPKRKSTHLCCKPQKYIGPRGLESHVARLYEQTWRTILRMPSSKISGAVIKLTTTYGSEPISKK